MIALVVAVATWTIGTVTLSILTLVAIDHARQTRAGHWQDWQ